MEQAKARTDKDGKLLKSLVLCGSAPEGSSSFDAVETVEIAGVPVAFGRVEISEPSFDPGSPEDESMVLIAVRAFSCNFRDKALMLLWERKCSADPSYFCSVGSEFVGEVLAVGSGVIGLREGDRVIANGQYPEPVADGALPGLPTNHASRGYLKLHEAKLIKVPETMPDEVAAAFGLGAQTSYSMLRKLSLAEGANVLVTAARSNTSLFAINALKRHLVNVYATSTSAWTGDELAKTGLEELVRIDPDLENFAEDERIKAIVSEIGGFDCVIDPFFDLHIGKVIDAMNPGAAYTTCGFYDQYSQLTGDGFRYRGKGLSEIMAAVVVNNLRIIGNCLGQTEDLRRAIEDYAAGDLDVTIDSVFHGRQVGEFLNRTYNATDRFGKVVYRYADDG